MMLKSFVLIVFLSEFLCDAQNFPYPRHPDEILREVAEPSAAALARRALRGLSISEVIKGVYPTLPTPSRSPSSIRREPQKEQLPVPEALRQEPPIGAPIQTPAQQITTSPVVQTPTAVQTVSLDPTAAPGPNEARVASETPIQFLSGNQVLYPSGGETIAPLAREIGPVSSGIQAPAPNRNVVDLNVLPRPYQPSPARPAANINVVPVSPSAINRLRVDSGRSQAYNEASRPRSDSSDDYYDSYEFGYEIRTPEGTHSHEERKIPTGQVFGSYSMILADGRQRLVTYSADGQGFHPIVETNELGTLTSEPADARIISSATIPSGETPTQPRRIRKTRKTKAKKTSS